jgi:hypothetical protein
VNGYALLGAVAAGAVVILLGVVALVWWNRGDRRSRPPDAWERPQAPVFGGDPMPETLIPSSEEDYRFLFSAKRSCSEPPSSPGRHRPPSPSSPPIAWQRPWA